MTSFEANPTLPTTLLIQSQKTNDKDNSSPCPIILNYEENKLQVSILPKKLKKHQKEKDIIKFKAISNP